MAGRSPRCWANGDFLGRGSLGFVRKGLYQDRRGKLHPAAIVLPDGNEEACHALLAELKLFDRLSADHHHLNVVTCFGGDSSVGPLSLQNVEQIKSGQARNVLVFELLTKNLKQFLYECREVAKTCTYRQVLGIFLDVSRALVLFERMETPHRNLKPENILIDEKGTAKVAGCFAASSSTDRPCGRGETGNYAPPRLILSRTAAEAAGDTFTNSDHAMAIYAIGVMMAEFLAGGRQTDVLVERVPDQLWRFIQQCSGTLCGTNEAYVRRPDASELVEKLEDLLRKPWVGDKLPWVEVNRRRALKISLFLIFAIAVKAGVNKLIR